MPWAVSCCPFGASLGANLLNAAPPLYTPKALPAPQVLYTAEGLYTQLCCFTHPKDFTRSSAALHAPQVLYTAAPPPYLLSFHVAPSLVSFTSKPKAANSSRILSLVAQSLLAFALARRSSTMSTTLPKASSRAALPPVES